MTTQRWIWAGWKLYASLATFTRNTHRGLVLLVKNRVRGSLRWRRRYNRVWQFGILLHDTWNNNPTGVVTMTMMMKCCRQFWEFICVCVCVMHPDLVSWACGMPPGSWVRLWATESSRRGPPSLGLWLSEESTPQSTERRRSTRWVTSLLPSFISFYLFY